VIKAYELLREVGTIKARRGAGWFVTEAIPPIHIVYEAGSQACTRPNPAE